jgi:hypothetical protein
VSRGATEDLVAKLEDYEGSDLPERTKVALRLADRLAGEQPKVDAELHAQLRRHFTDDQIIDLGMTLTFASGWQRFIEAFGIRPDNWSESTPLPWERGAASAGPRYSPMSSAHRAGLAAMNRSISSRHRASWTTSTFTPRLRSRASSPMNV